MSSSLRKPLFHAGWDKAEYGPWEKTNENIGNYLKFVIGIIGFLLDRIMLMIQTFISKNNSL